MENQSKIRKVIFNEISLATGLIALVVSVMVWVQNPVAALEKGDVQTRADIIALQVRATQTETNLNLRLVAMQIQLDRVEARQIEVLQSLARLEQQHK